MLAYAPLILFGVIYVLTCLLGALLLLFDFRPYAALFEHFSGVRAPHERADLLPTQLMLLFGAPFLFGIAYMATMRLRVQILESKVRRLQLPDLSTRPWLPQFVFYAVATVAILSLTNFGSMPDLRVWFDPQAGIDARYAIFRELGFGEFVNVYTLLPLSAAWVALTWRSDGLRAALVRWLPLVISVAVSVLLFQKRPAVNDVLIVMSALVLALNRRNPRKAKVTVLLAAAAAAFLYLALAAVPAYFATRIQIAEPSPSRAPNAESSVTPAPNAEYPVTPTLGAQAGPSATPAIVAEGNKVQTVLLYALLGPLNRTSASALYYPVVFPSVHPYYGLDLGQDMLSKLPWFHFAPMPDDNIVIWDVMAPAMPGGRTAAPFQFVLFSQVGLVGALIGSIVIGFALALVWRFVIHEAVPTTWSSLAGSMILLLAVFLAMDSVRNSVLVSYGVFWGMLFIVFAMIFTATVNRLTTSRRSRAPSQGFHQGSPESHRSGTRANFSAAPND